MDLEPTLGRRRLLVFYSRVVAAAAALFVPALPNPALLCPHSSSRPSPINLIAFLDFIRLQIPNFKKILRVCAIVRNWVQ